MDAETKTYVENIDGWIKQIRCEFSEISGMSHIIEESVGNIQHNYELIQELKDEVENLKRELGALKLIQFVSLRDKLVKRV